MRWGTALEEVYEAEAYRVELMELAGGPGPAGHRKSQGKGPYPKR